MSSENLHAAQYLRMSREHQKYSPENQALAIADYAQMRGLKIVQTYRDDGRSGLTLKGRQGLKRLLADVLGGAASFRHVLVLDVSRWGRFQDPDQAAHYEFLCRDAGVQLHYCADGFENDGSGVANIMKNLKRLMAAEFSRELGRKVWSGQANATRRGFKQGGPAPFALRRMMIDESGAAVRLLKRGQWKSVQTDRVVLVHGPDHEVAAVRNIFRWFVRDRLPFREIARRLQAQGVTMDDGAYLTPTQVGRILRTETYAGVYTWNKTNQQLRGGTRRNPEAKWISTNMIDPIISRRMFASARSRLAKRNWKTYSTEQLLEHLRRLHTEHGEVTFAALRAANRPSPALYYRRFKSLTAALELAGCARAVRQRQVDPEAKLPRAQLVDALKALYEREGRLSGALINADPNLPCCTYIRDRFGSLINAYREAGWEVTQAQLRPLANKLRWSRSRETGMLSEHSRQVIADHE